MTSKTVAIVTGAGSGIGAATAGMLASRGIAVVCADIADSDTADRIVDAGGSAVAAHLDVRRADQWEDIVGVVAPSLGRLGYLANIAGIVTDNDTVLDLIEADWGRVIDIDLTGTWLGMRACIPTFLASEFGRIVNIASEAAVLGLPGLASYSAAKGGVTSLTRQAAAEYGARNILVNAVAPGTIDTPILADINAEQRAVFAASHVIPRLGTPQEIAQMVTFLLLDSTFITGQTIAVDGGWSIK